MRRRSLPTYAVLPALAGLAAAAIAVAGPAGAAGGAPVAAAPAAAPAAAYRQLIGQVSRPTYLEASTPAAGKYRIEYEITGTAYFDTYVDGIELGYVGGPTGTYRTRSLRLSAGGHLVQVVGPEGSGSAKVYLAGA